VGDAPRGRQVHAPGMTPGPPLPPLSALGRVAGERGVEKKNRRADGRGPLAAAASEGRGTHGRGRCAADTRGQCGSGCWRLTGAWARVAYWAGLLGRVRAR